MRLAQLEKAIASGPMSTFSECSSRTTPVVHWLVCSTIFFREFESARELSRLRLRSANLRWSHCSYCQVRSVALSLMTAGAKVIDPWPTTSHWVCNSGSTAKPKQSGRFPPLASPPGPQQRFDAESATCHGGGLPARSGLKSASSGDIQRSPGEDLPAWLLSRSTVLIRLMSGTRTPAGQADP